MENQATSERKKSHTSWWPFGGKKPDTDEENALSSTPSKIGKPKI